MRVREMSFVKNASPLGQGRSSQAKEFARRASNKLLPWLKDHYELYTLDQAAFSPSNLYNYHLRGDYYLGLTKNGPPALENLRLASPGPGRLVNVAELPGGYAGLTSADLATSISAGRPIYPGPQEFGVIGASSALAAAPIPSHFFAREVASGSMLTEFLFAEQASMSYRLLPYMDNFHTEVRNFIINDILHFINNIRHLQTTPHDNSNPTAVHESVDLTNMAVPGASLLNELDALSGVLPNFTTTSVGLIEIPGNPNVNMAAYPTFGSIIGTVGREMPFFIMPIHMVIHAYREYVELIQPGLNPGTANGLEQQFGNLLTQAVRASYIIGGHYSLNAAGDYDFNNRFFTSQARTGGSIFRSMTTNQYNENTTRNALQNFLDTYFRLVSDPVPIGTLVNLNINATQGSARQVIDDVFNNQTRTGEFDFVPAIWQPNDPRVLAGAPWPTPADPIPIAGTPQPGARNQHRLNRNQIDTFFGTHGTIFEVIGMSEPTGRRNNRVRRYQLASRDASGAPSAEILELQNIREHYSDQKVPGFVLHRYPDQGANNLRANTPLNIIGRLLLSASYSIFNAGSYFSASRDMRKLRGDNAPGHYPPLNEAMGPAAHGRSAHKRGDKFGVIDLYAEQRADLIADYLAAMYDNLKGRYKDAFVAFYDGDMHVNEMSYYTSAVSNYISSEVAPEDINREPVLVGPRLTTRLPQESTYQVYEPEHPEVQAGREIAGTQMRQDMQVVNLRNADPELVYYQIDSPLLRQALQQLNTQFYNWYVTIAEQLDRGQRNITRAGNEQGDEYTAGTNNMVYPLLSVGGSGSSGGRDPAQDRQPVRSSKAILSSMWPLIRSRVESSIQSGETPAHIMLRQLAMSVAAHRANTSQAIPAVPISTSFINYGELLRSPATQALPPSLEAKDALAFIDYLESTYYNDYGLIGQLAGNIETIRTQNYNQDQLIAAFKKYYRSYRETKALNRFTFPATAYVVNIFRSLVALPASVRAAEAAVTTTDTPPAPEEQDAPAVPIPEPMRRI